MIDVFVARQPIFDRHDTLAGYELLYRNTAASTIADGAAADAMCTDTVIHSFLDIGLDDLTDGHRAYVNCTREFLLDGQVELLPPKQVVIEVLETVGNDPAVVAACQRLTQRGYQLALDDYVDDPSYDALLATVCIVKIDVLHRKSGELAALLKRLRPFNVKVLAECVETMEMHQECMHLGFDLFQGYFYRRPELVTRKEIEVGQAAMLRLLNMLRDGETPDSAIESGFRSDPTLTYKLLRIVNSASVGGRGIDSIGFAIRMVGRQMLYRWLALLMVSSMVTGSDISDQLVYAALLRARLCELIAESSPQVRHPQALFMTGLFSMLDVLLRMPMADVLARVSVSDEIRQAVMEGTGPYAEPLLLADAYQRGEWDQVDTLASSLGVLPMQMAWLYTKSLAWVNEQLTSVKEAAAA
ncbi:MAG: EAL domain-containing protein [Gemmatimonadota bacterium]|nr:EAL domain-containing protein [Gemmatimonadota bacterium]